MFLSRPHSQRLQHDSQLAQPPRPPAWADRKLIFTAGHVPKIYLSPTAAPTALEPCVATSTPVAERRLTSLAEGVTVAVSAASAASAARRSSNPACRSATCSGDSCAHSRTRLRYRRRSIAQSVRSASAVTVVGREPGRTRSQPAWRSRRSALRVRRFAPLCGQDEERPIGRRALGTRLPTSVERPAAPSRVAARRSGRRTLRRYTEALHSGVTPGRYTQAFATLRRQAHSGVRHGAHRP